MEFYKFEEHQLFAPQPQNCTSHISKADDTRSSRTFGNVNIFSNEFGEETVFKSFREKFTRIIFVNKNLLFSSKKHQTRIANG
jgi:hypothetical protein